MIHAAGKISKTKPSTNVPIQCIFCPRDCPSTHWKYNIQRHLDERHPSWRTYTGKEVSTFFDAVRITDEEEDKLGISEEKRTGVPFFLLIYLKSIYKQDYRERPINTIAST